MSERVGWWIVCDGCERTCPNSPLVSDVPVVEDDLPHLWAVCPTVTYAHEEAVRKGWISDAGRDLCPTCQTKENQP